MDVSVIIVNYNTKDMLADCIDSILQYTKDVSFEVIVSDNGSIDGSIEMMKEKYHAFSNIKLIENGENLGFGAANNRALEVAQGKYILYLNSDTLLLNNAIYEFFHFYENHPCKESIGCLGCQLENLQGQKVSSFGNYITSVGMLKAILHMWYVAKAHKPITTRGAFATMPDMVELDGYIIGADMFLLNDENARFDERFFMYAEETDLQWNAFTKNGRKNILISAPKIVHLEGGSSKKEKEAVVYYDFFKRSTAMLWTSNMKYLKKNCSNHKLLNGLCCFMLKTIWKSKSEGQEYVDWLANLDC